MKEGFGARRGISTVVKTHKAPLRLLSVLVFVALAATSVGLSIVVRDIVHDQQKKLLHERTTEGGTVLSTVFGGTQSALTTLAATAHPRVGATGRFTAAARPFLGLATTIGALSPANGHPSVLAAVGTGPALGTTVSDDRTALAMRALATKGVVSAVVGTPAGPRLSFALATDTGLVLYEDVAFDPTKPYDAGPNGPFSDLDGALYASSREDAATLVLTTARHLPLSGMLERQTINVGADHWLLVTNAKRPLVGSFAAKAPWGVLLGGLLTALLTTVLVETLSRRRGYALALVDARTLELRKALDKQARLEQDERKAREAAEAADRSKSEFLSRMSHELRTPLNAVLGFAQLLELDELTDPQQESVDQIVKGGRHLLELINEVLDISRIETGTLALSPEPVLVRDVIAETLSLMRPLADHRHIRLVADPVADRETHVLTDRQRLKQILLNLVANAVKYNHEAGTVSVSCEQTADNRLRITVTDTGPGIRAENLDLLFVPFERLGAERGEVEGAGVGLALSRRLAEAMGATLDVASTYGQGSRFWMELSIVEGPVEQYERLHEQPTASTDTPITPPVERNKVLYIEDNLSNIRLVERVLARRDDVEVIPATQGRLGLALARDHQPKLVLLDLHLPDMDGDEVLRQLRQDPLTSTIPVVMLSADATAGQIERLLAMGATAYLTKPLEVRDLLDLLAETIAGSPLSTA